MLKRSIAFVALLACAGTVAASTVKGNAAAGQDKAKTCASCHGPTGNESVDNQYPKLAGQYPDYLVKALKDYRSGARSNPTMAGMAAGLGDQDINDLAVYFSQQKAQIHDLSDIAAR